jgi:hypothetical protein
VLSALLITYPEQTELKRAQKSAAVNGVAFVAAVSFAGHKDSASAASGASVLASGVAASGVLASGVLASGMLASDGPASATVPEPASIEVPEAAPLPVPVLAVPEVAPADDPVPASLVAPELAPDPLPDEVPVDAGGELLLLLHAAARRLTVTPNPNLLRTFIFVPSMSKETRRI